MSKGELLITNILKTLNVNYKLQKTFNNCKYKRKLKFDFYLPDYNSCIEFDGLYHYKIIKNKQNSEQLKSTQLRDQIKNEFCKQNNIKLLRIPYWETKNLLQIIKNLLNEQNVNRT